MPGPTYPAALANALEFDWSPPLVGDSVVYTSNNTYACIAKYFGQQVLNQLLAAIAMSTTDKSWQVAYTCLAGDAVGSPVYINGNNSVTTANASDSTRNQVIGFIRFKGVLGEANVPSSTTCYLQQFVLVAGLSGTAGQPCYLSNTGTYSATPGSIKTPLGVFISATQAILFAGPIAAGSQTVTTNTLANLGVLPNPVGTQIYRAWELFR